MQYFLYYDKIKLNIIKKIYMTTNIPWEWQEPTKKFTLVKKQDLKNESPELKSTKIDELYIESNIKLKLAQENFVYDTSKELFKIALELGFDESNEMIQIRKNLNKWQDFNKNYSLYEDLAQESINKSNNLIKWQIALLMVKSLIFLELLDKNKFKENLADAIEYMNNLNNDEYNLYLNQLELLINKK